MGNNPVVEARGTRGQVAPSARGEERGLSAAVGDSGIGCSAQCLEQRQHHVTTTLTDPSELAVRTSSAAPLATTHAHNNGRETHMQSVNQLVSQVVIQQQQQQPETFEKK